LGRSVMTQTLLAGVILLASWIAVAAAADVLGPTEKKTIVRDLLKSFETRDLAPMHYVDEAKYIQHNPKRRGRQGRTEEAPGATAGGYQDRDATAVGGR